MAIVEPETTQRYTGQQITSDTFTQCLNCTCRRCDALEEQAKDIEARLSAMERIEAKALNHARLKAARENAPLISSRDMQRRKGVSRQTVLAWQARPDFPHFVKDSVGNKPRLWSSVDFERWYGEYAQKNMHYRAWVKKKTPFTREPRKLEGGE